MVFPLRTVLESVMLVTALSTDAFVASLAYGSNKIKIPFVSVQIINAVCSSILAVSLLMGSVIRAYIPSELTKIICFVILFILGITKLMDSTIKSIIKKNSDLNKQIKFSMFNLNFILSLYASPEKADVDTSKILSPAEAVSLAVALSLDGLMVGIGAAFGNINILQAVIFSFICGTAAIIMGHYIGNKIAEKAPLDLSWLSGILLIVLAFLKL